MSIQATAALKQVWVSAPDDNFIWQTVELSHSRFSATYYLTDAVDPFTATIENGSSITFQPLPFLVRLPTSDGEGLPLLSLSLSNAGQEMVNEIAAANAAPRERIQMVLRVYISTDLSASQSAPLRLGISEVNMSDEVITARASRSDLLNSRFPGEVYTPEKYPGLQR